MTNQDIAKEYKKLFSDRGYSVRKVSIYVNVDGKGQGINMMTVNSDSEIDLYKIKRDLEKSKFFFDMKVTSEVDWNLIDWVGMSESDLKGDLPIINVLTVYMKEIQ